MDTGAESYSRYLEGDESALTEIISAYRDGLTLYLNGILGSIFDAEELMEEVFFRLVTRRPRFRGESSFKTWLYAMGRHLALDLLRRRKRLSDRPPEEADAETESVERAYLRDERRVAVHRAMGRLNPDYAQVLHLVYFEGLTNAQAAAVMGRGRRQIENLTSRARAALRRELIKEGFDYEDI